MKVRMLFDCYKDAEDTDVPYEDRDIGDVVWVVFHNGRRIAECAKGWSGPVVTVYDHERLAECLKLAEANCEGTGR